MRKSRSTHFSHLFLGNKPEICIKIKKFATFRLFRFQLIPLPITEFIDQVKCTSKSKASANFCVVAR